MLLMIIFYSCDKENKVENTSKVKSVSKGELIINELNYKKYLDSPEVKFFFQDVKVAGIKKAEDAKSNVTLCVQKTSDGKTLCQDFKTTDDACIWGAYCKSMRPYWYYNYMIGNQTWDCVCRGIGCLSK